MDVMTTQLFPQENWLKSNKLINPETNFNLRAFHLLISLTFTL